MNTDEFIASIYLGDRACKAFALDCWNSELKVLVDCISRVREETWNYYDAEDLENGYLVFEGVKRLQFDPQGPIPNDLINELSVTATQGSEIGHLFTLRIDSVDDEGVRTEVTINIQADSLALEAKDSSAVRIRN
jgi:hypothetical protein